MGCIRFTEFTDLFTLDVGGLIDAIVDRLVKQRDKLLEKLDDLQI